MNTAVKIYVCISCKQKEETKSALPALYAEMRGKVECAPQSAEIAAFTCKDWMDFIL